MTRKAFFNLSAACIAGTLAIGLPSTALNASDGDAPRANPARADSAAQRSANELNRGRAARALRYAIQAVDYDATNAGHRASLGHAYMANGRFLSAEQSFSTARELGLDNARTIIGHSLSLIATGRNDDAVALLDSYADRLPASDFGLALALAGQVERGAMVLTDVVRAGDASPRDRQNLALALAMNGRWLESRLLAAQDLGANGAAERLQGWATMLQSPSPQMRVAGLIGATPVSDEGMPVRFALNGSLPQVALGSAADPAPLAMYAPPPPVNGDAVVETAMAEAAAPEALSSFVPAPSAPVVAEAVVPVAEQAPVQMASADSVEFYSDPVIQTLRTIVAVAAPQARAAAPSTAPRRARPVAAAAPTAAPAAAASAASAPSPRASAPAVTGWAVQLGAFENLGAARDAWSRLSRAHSGLGAADGVSTSATVGGRTVYRLSATGYDSRAAATSACAAIARAGGACFVRQLTNADRVRWASRSVPTRVASR